MSNSRILIVEDEEKLLEHLSSTFQNEEFSVFTCSKLRDLEDILDLPAKKFDVIVLDRLLHGRDAATMVPQLKASLPDTKVMILSAINTPSEKAALLNSGADDYLAKPFDSDELLARVRVLIRRSSPGFTVGNLTLDVVNRTVRINDRELPLTNKEFLLLKTLGQTPGKIFSKAALYEHVWEMSPEVESNVVETTVNKLRRRLEELEASTHIRNSRNLGYWIEE